MLSIHSHLKSLPTLAFLLLWPFSFVVGERTYTDRITIGPSIGQDLLDLLLDDFTGDGNPDLIATTGQGTQISFVKNEGQGLFGLPVSIASNRYFGKVRAVASGDFNNDGLNDFVVTINHGSNTDAAVRIYWNDAQNPGTFNEFSNVIPDTNLIGSTMTLAQVQGRDVQVFDMNDDGFPDILVTVIDDVLGNTVDNGMLLLLENDGTGNFDVQVLSEELQGHGSIAIGDYNADGLPDIAVNARYRNVIFSWTNNGDGTYKKKVVDNSASSNWAMSSGDVNGDGYDDLLCQGESTTTLYVNNQDGTFQELYQYEVDGRFVSGNNRKTMIHDVDGDGLMDLVSMPGDIFWQKQTSTDPLEFSSKLNLLADTGSDEITPSGFTFEDVDGDGILDLVACQYTSPHSVYAYLGKDSPSPTAATTKPPTKSPTKRPTKSPTKSPTKAPIQEIQPISVDDGTVKEPTLPPVKEPTVSPSSAPTETPDTVVQFSFVAFLSNETSHADVEIAFTNSTRFYAEHPNISSPRPTPGKVRKLSEESTRRAGGRLLEPADLDKQESYTIDVSVTNTSCNIVAGTECVFVVVTLTAPDNDDIMGELVESAVQDGSYFNKLFQNGLEALVVHVPGSESPILPMPTPETPKPTNSPTEPPTLSSNISSSCNTDPVSGAMPKSTSWITIVSGVFSAILLCLA